MTKQTKAKRRLSDFDFTQEGSHIALVHKDQGGAANGYDTLVMKATAKYSPEIIQKASMIQVTLTFEEFLGKFFDMWYTDAKVLATLLGMQDDEDEDEGDWYKNHVAEQVDKFQILKAAADAENKIDFLATLDGADYLSILQTQERFEKALKTQAESGGKKPEPETEQDTVQTIVTKAAPAVHKEDNSMTDSAKKEPELVTKSQYEEIQKAFDEQKVALQKATERLEEFERVEKARVAQARKDAVTAAVEDTDEAEKLFKAVGNLPEEDFQTVVDVVKALAAKVDDSALFTEQGSPVEGEKVQKSTLQTQIEKQLSKKA